MNKAEMLKALEGFDDSTEIVIWNSVVGDWQGVAKVSEAFKVKETLECFTETAKLRAERNGEDLEDVEELHKTLAWRVVRNPQQGNKDTQPSRKYYDSQLVALVEPLERQLEVCDRFGSTKY